MFTEKQLLQYAVSELKQLRQISHDQRLRLEMFDDMMSIFNAQRGSRTMGMMHPDVVHEIDKYLEKENGPMAGSVNHQE